MSSASHSVVDPAAQSVKSRYIKLALLVIVAGNIYPLIYLRQNFQVTILEVFNLTASQLGQNYAMLGLLYVASYIPSGWLADRFAPHVLMSFSLAAAGLLGVWFAQVPSFEATQIIFAGWGLAAGLTFWAALIKATAVIAQPTEQGRFFGILEGGRGLVEAILATLAVGIFAWATNSAGQSSTDGLQKVIWMYVICMLVLAPITYFVLQDQGSAAKEPPNSSSSGVIQFWSDLKTVASNLNLWLCAICIWTGYQLFFATYSFSAYLQNVYGMTAVAVGVFTVAKLWMRPLGAVSAGFLGDFSNLERLLSALLLSASLALISLLFIPVGAAGFLLLGVVLVIGFLTYAIRGIFWSTLESCGVSNKIKGLAIGVISMLGYSPDIYLPLLEGSLVESMSPRDAYTIYFGLIAAGGFVGAGAAFWLSQRVAKGMAQ